MEHPEVFDSKFSFLFEPIKDLAKNFNIDLNHHLDEYLNQLESDDVVVRNGSINFVEAALILRGSAAVYSKKVDYLYNLTLKILETLTGNQQNKKTLVEEELDEDVGSSEMANMSMLDNINLSKNLICREDVDETTLSTVMPLSLQGQNASNQNLEDKKMKSESDRKNFTLNNCKIFNSTLILNYLEMKSLLLCLDDDDDDDDDDDARNEIQNDIHTLHHSYSCDREEICDPVIMEEWPEMENIATDDNFHMETEEDPKELCLLKIQKIEREHRKVKALKLLDPYESEHEKFVKSAKTGRTFKFPRSLSKKGKIKKYPSAIKCFVENFKEGCSRSSDEVSNGSSIDKEFEDFLIKKILVKGDKICTEECTEDHESHGVENNDDGYDAIYHCDDIDVVNIDVQDDCQINDVPEGVYAVDNVESYEEAIKHHLAQFFNSANKFKVTSDLMQRVGEWESKISKVLEGTLRLYDVHMYSMELIQQLENCGGSEAPVRFSSVVADKDHIDVCRMFMSALHLANHHNIEIVNNQEPDSFLLKLLSKDLHSDGLDHFTP